MRKEKIPSFPTKIKSVLFALTDYTLVCSSAAFALRRPMIDNNPTQYSHLKYLKFSCVSRLFSFFFVLSLEKSFKGRGAKKKIKMKRERRRRRKRRLEKMFVCVQGIPREGGVFLLLLLLPLRVLTS